MKTFTDEKKRVWEIAVNVQAIKRVRGLLSLDLLEVVEGKLIERLIRDPVLLCDVVYAVCKPQADAAGVTDEEFGQAMAGDAIDHATTALLTELVDFSPSPRDRANLGRVLTATGQAMEKARDLIEKRIESIDVGAIVEQALSSVGGSSSSAPGQSASTPDRSLSPS